MELSVRKPSWDHNFPPTRKPPYDCNPVTKVTITLVTDGDLVLTLNMLISYGVSYRSSVVSLSSMLNSFGTLSIISNKNEIVSFEIKSKFIRFKFYHQ